MKLATRSDVAETAYSTEDFAPYRNVLRSIYDAVFELRDAQPTIVRAIDLYSPVLADWRAAGIDLECTAAWETWSEVIRGTAAEYGVPTVSMYDALNGPDHQRDPRLAGYISSDQKHTSGEGRGSRSKLYTRWATHRSP